MRRSRAYIFLLLVALMTAGILMVKRNQLQSWVVSMPGGSSEKKASSVNRQKLPEVNNVESFFTNTPLRAVYDALAIKNTPLAYQELTLALQKGELDQTGRHWMKAAQVILEQSQCGRSLVSATSDGSHLRVTYLISSNPRRQFAYQILVSSLGQHEQLNFDFKDTKGQQWFSGSLAKSNEYEVYQSPEWLTPFPSGAYRLSVNNKNHYSIFIAPENDKDWLDPWSQRGSIHLNLPMQIAGCPPVTVSQLWFDEDYNIIGEPVFLNNKKDIQLPSEYPGKAVWYSAAVSFFYYHGGIQVEYKQRVTLPIAWLPEKKVTGNKKEKGKITKIRQTDDIIEKK